MPRCRRFALGVSLVGVLLGEGIVFFTMSFVLSGFEGNAVLPADCAVVFGAAVHRTIDDNGNIVSNAGPGIQRRVQAAVQLYREGKIAKIFMTGGKGDAYGLSEAEVMRDVALTMGVEDTAIVTETNARSTVENIRYTKPLTGSCSSVVGISDRYHLARIGYLAGREGWELSTYPAQGIPDRKFLMYSVIREIGALFMYTVQNLFT